MLSCQKKITKAARIVLQHVPVGIYFKERKSTYAFASTGVFVSTAALHSNLLEDKRHPGTNR